MFNDNFDRDFKRVSTAIIVGWILFALFDLAIVAGIIYVAIHFLGKYW